MTVKHLANYKKTNYLTVSSGTSVNAITFNPPFFNTEPLTSFTYNKLELTIKLCVQGWTLQSTYGSNIDLIYTCRWNPSTPIWTGHLANTYGSAPIISSPGTNIDGIFTGGGGVVFSNPAVLNSNITIPILYLTANQQLDIAVWADIYAVYSS
jgi:hypothetical protein